ncbi:hypothetical protein RHOSPDRAFT_27557 [Rhodotorula sp. JG-1b]|nr:hypothetical protein RHOSPDRAFT_27557 [Rhodotorula sp. JG-1b]
MYLFLQEDGNNFRGKRPPRAPRPRQELEMTASGPMAQGPGGPPTDSTSACLSPWSTSLDANNHAARAWGARPAAGGSSGAAVMAASRAGTLNQMLDADSDASDLEVDDDPLLDEGSGALRFKAVDLNDIGTVTSPDDTTLPPLTLPRDPKVQHDSNAWTLLTAAREKAKSEGALAGVKPEPGDESMPTSATATPAPIDSKEGSLALFSVDEEKEAKDLRDLEQEEKKEIILSEAFDLAASPARDPGPLPFPQQNADARGELYMFQFPRRFPNFVPSSKSKKEQQGASASSMADLSLAEGASVKGDPDAPPPRRKAAPPPWGRFGTRQEKAARWSEHAGRIGELCVHQSGKVTLRLAGDLRYEVLPAAQPSFLQEIAVLDHPSKRPATASGANGSKSCHESSDSASEASDSDSDVSRSSISSLSDLDGKDSADEEKKARQEKKQARKDKKEAKKKMKQKPAQEIPADSLVLLGQTSKKFIVVPDMQDLLEKVGQEERAEKEAERRAKLEKANRAAAIAKKREGTAAPRR